MTTATTGRIEATKQQHDEIGNLLITDFLARITPDTDLTAKAEAFRVPTRQLLALRNRRSEIEARIQDISIALVDAKADAAARLLGERALLAAEAGSLPAQIVEVAKRCTLAQLAFYKRLHQVARDEIGRCDDALAEPLGENVQIKRQIARDDSRAARRATLTLDQRRELFDRSREVVADMQPALRLRSLAEWVARIAVEVAQSYGPDVALYGEGTWPKAVERAARAVRSA